MSATFEKEIMNKGAGKKNQNTITIITLNDFIDISIELPPLSCKHSDHACYHI